MESLGSDRYPNVSDPTNRGSLERRSGNTNVGYTLNGETGVGMAKREIDEYSGSISDWEKNK